MIPKTVFDGIRFCRLNQFFSGVPFGADCNLDQAWHPPKKQDLTSIKGRLISRASLNFRNRRSISLRGGYRIGRAKAALFGVRRLGWSRARRREQEIGKSNCQTS